MRLSIDPALLDSPQTRRVDKLLGVQDSWRFLLRLEAFALASKRADGTLYVSDGRVAGLCNSEPHPSFVAAMLEVGWLERDAAGELVVVGFADKYRSLFRRRETGKARQRRRRAASLAVPPVELAPTVVDVLPPPAPPEPRAPEPEPCPTTALVVVSAPVEPAPPAQLAMLVPAPVAVSVSKPGRKGRKAKTSLQIVDPDAMAVYHYWREIYHPRAATFLDTDSLAYRRIVERLHGDQRSVADLCDAIDGCHLTPYNIGRNSTGQKFLSLELICRDDAHVTKYIENKLSPPEPFDQQLHDTQMWILTGKSRTERAMDKFGERFDEWVKSPTKEAPQSRERDGESDSDDCD